MPHRCPHCPRVFRKIAYLAQHERHMHSRRARMSLAEPAIFRKPPRPPVEFELHRVHRLGERAAFRVESDSHSTTGARIIATYDSTVPAASR